MLKRVMAQGGSEIIFAGRNFPVIDRPTLIDIIPAAEERWLVGPSDLVHHYSAGVSPSSAAFGHPFTQTSVDICRNASPVFAS